MSAPTTAGAAVVEPNTLVLVDTNCLVRVYFSPLRPILGTPVSGYELKTLSELASELSNLAKRADFAWLTDPVIQKEVDDAIFPLTPAQLKNIKQDAKDIRSYGDNVIRNHCLAKGLVPVRTLSSADSRVLAAALELNCAVATDEWPLRLVTDRYDYDDGSPVRLFSSVELLSLLEQAGLLSPTDRKKTYSDWLKNGENLLYGSGTRYVELFSEAPPTAQG